MVAPQGIVGLIQDLRGESCAAMAEPILEVQSLTKRFGGFTALDAVSLDLGEGERLGLIGPNGSGKTTLINCISGALACDGGRVRLQGPDVTRLPALPARAARHHAQLPDPAPVPQHDGAREPLRAAGVRAASSAAAATCAHEALAILELVGLRRRAPTQQLGRV